MLLILSCNRAPGPQSPFKSGDIVYFKIDTTKALIKFELGQFDETNFIYRVDSKNAKNEVVSKFALSSELFKK